jgi:SAM-dependent methyltransferase
VTRYDAIGRSYSRTRRPDPRIEARIWAALGRARSVVNIGAGAGSYEPRDRYVVAVEPSATMVGQRAPDAAPAVRGVAEHLPFPDGAFDAALAVLTVHHWTDRDAGLREMRRVSRRQVVFFFEPAFGPEYWLIRDYLPHLYQLVDSERRAPDSADFAAVFDVRSVEPVPVPADCVDGFGACFWNRPEAYLDPDVQAGMSSFAQLDDETRSRVSAALRADLESGEWDARHGHLRALSEYDAGYRILTGGDDLDG